MRTEIKIENCPSPFCVIHTKEQSSDIDLLAAKISELDIHGNKAVISGWDGDFCINLKPFQILRIYSQNKKVFIESEKETLICKLRLYQFEDTAEQLGWTNFVRISNTDIVNIDYIEKFDLSLTGVIKIIMKNGTTATVSRRYMPKIRNKINSLRGIL